MKYILSLDQGTTSSRAILFDENGGIISISQKEFGQIFPQPGWVEHDANEILSTQFETAAEAVKQAGISATSIAAIGITNQRETTVVWDSDSGKPIYNAIVWQDRRTAEFCEVLKSSGQEKEFRDKTGLLLDAYFSGPKIGWILENIPGAKEKARLGKLRFGTIDSWLIWHLTKGKVHATDPSNASRTLLYNIHSETWDESLLNLMKVPLSMMPEVKESADNFGFAEFSNSIFGGLKIPIFSAIGDQQAALFGQACFEEGQAKNTYGTGCFMLMNTGGKSVKSESGLLTTIAWKLKGELIYALEGSVFIAGAAVQWLRDGLGLISQSSESETLAASVDDTGGVYFVPAFVGLGAPYWDMYARGTITGITRGTTKAHIVRATLEAIAYQTAEVLEAMEKDAGIHLNSLKADGGMTENNFLMNFQANILNLTVEKPENAESTAWGAAALAGIKAGLWDVKKLATLHPSEKSFFPKMENDVRKKLIDGWKKAVNGSLSGTNQGMEK